MKRPMLSVMAIVSVFAVAVLAVGYVGQLGPQIVTHAPAAPQPFYREVTLTVEDGRVAWWCDTWSAAPRVGTPTGTHVTWLHRLLPPRAPSLRRSLWDFDNHALPMRPPGPRAYLVAFPIWCAAVPFLIAPALWWRARRRSRKPARGFDVGAGGFARPLAHPPR
jgi:hypothetical protein